MKQNDFAIMTIIEGRKERMKKEVNCEQMCVLQKQNLVFPKNKSKFILAFKMLECLG